MSKAKGKWWYVLTCEHYSELASQKFDAPLSGKERCYYWLHHVICTFCRRMNRQFGLIDKMARKEPLATIKTMPKDAKDRLKAKLSSSASDQ